MDLTEVKFRKIYEICVNENSEHGVKITNILTYQNLKTVNN